MQSSLAHDKKKLRACLLCSLVKTSDQFRQFGCDNCQLLQIQLSSSRLADCTSLHFEGLVALLEPTQSWVGKWQRTGNFVRGLYAVRVTGTLPQVVQEELHDKGIAYRPRDGSALE